MKLNISSTIFNFFKLICVLQLYSSSIRFHRLVDMLILNIGRPWPYEQPLGSQSLVVLLVLFFFKKKNSFSLVGDYFVYSDCIRSFNIVFKLLTFFYDFFKQFESLYCNLVNPWTQSQFLALGSSLLYHNDVGWNRSIHLSLKFYHEAQKRHDKTQRHEIWITRTRHELTWVYKNIYFFKCIKL